MNNRANSKADQVYRAVKEAILSGALEPGAPIDKMALCERLSVSRFPVSAAISRLAFERLARVQPQHGSFVARISARDVRERLMIRRAVEGEVAAEAARRLTREGLAALRDNLAKAERAVDTDDRERFLHARCRLSCAHHPRISALLAAANCSMACASTSNGCAAC